MNGRSLVPKLFFLSVGCLLSAGIPVCGQTSAAAPQGDLVRTTGREESAEVYYLSYEALARVAEAIVGKIRERNPEINSLIICGARECGDLIEARLRYEFFDASSQEIIAEYRDLEDPAERIVARLERLPPEALAGDQRYDAAGSGERGLGAATRQINELTGVIIPARTSVLAAFDLVNLFTKTDVRIASTPVTADDSALSTAIVARIKSTPDTRQINVYLPGFDQLENVDIARSAVFRNYRTLTAKLRMGEAYDGVFNRYASVRVSYPDAEKIDALRYLNKNTRIFLHSLAAAPPPTGRKTPAAPAAANAGAEINLAGRGPDLGLLEDLIIGEKVGAMLADRRAMILQVRVIKLIGTSVAKRNMIFGTKNRFSGSAVVQYVLTDRTGELVYANTEVFHTGFKKMSDLQEKRQ